METDFAWKVTIDEIKDRDYNLDFKNPNIAEEEFEDVIDMVDLKPIPEIILNVFRRIFK